MKVCASWEWVLSQTKPSLEVPYLIMLCQDFLIYKIFYLLILLHIFSPYRSFVYVFCLLVLCFYRIPKCIYEWVACIYLFLMPFLGFFSMCLIALSCSNVIAFVLLYFVLWLFPRSHRKEMDLDGREGWETLGGVEEGEL